MEFTFGLEGNFDMNEALFETIVVWMENRGFEIILDNNEVFYFDVDKEKYKFLCRYTKEALEKMIEKYKMDSIEVIK